MEINVVIVGNIAFDINTFPKRDNGKDKIVVNNGGAGYYSLIPSSLYTKTGIVARIGNDFAIKNLKRTDIDLTGLKVVSDTPTTKFHHTYISSDGQSRTFRPEIYEKCMITINDFPEEYFNAKYIHIATNFPYRQKQFIDLIRKKSKALISIDTHEAYMETEPEFIRQLFDSVDIAFIDKEYTNLLDCKAPIKIIKKGKDGCEYRSKNMSFTAFTHEESVIDKTGAGDVVAGAFLGMLSVTNNKQRSLENAVKMATKSISNYGVDFLIEQQKER